MSEEQDWFPSEQDIRAMLRAKAPHLQVAMMTIGEVWIALGQEHVCPACQHCGATCIVALDDEDAEEATSGTDTHRCAACGRHCHWEQPPCA